MPRLLPFLTASILLHGMALAIGHHAGWLEGGNDLEILPTSLDVARSPARAPKTTHRQAGSPSIPDATHSPPVMANPSTGNASTVAGDNANLEGGAATAQVRAQIVSDLARHFYYPPIARMRSWEGRVLLAFRIEQDGQLRAPRVARTSGFGVLDQAALNSLRKVERVANAGHARLELEIPVIYRLTDAR